MKHGKVTKEVCVQVFVSRKYPKDQLPDGAVVPKAVAGAAGERVRTDVIEAGVFRPLINKKRYRPVRGGCSIGNLTRHQAGTLGGWACDNSDNRVVFLTCSHVVTARGARTVIPKRKGIVQPGQLDGGTTPSDLIGKTKRITGVATNPVQTSAPSNALDAAICSITVPRLDKVLKIGLGIYETATPNLGDEVQKYGRSTGLTNGSVLGVTAQSMILNYGTANTPEWASIGEGNSVFLIFGEDGKPFSDDGDSGALIFLRKAGQLQGTFPVIGLLFGANDNNMIFGACDINEVFSTLNLTNLYAYYLDALIQTASGRGRTKAKGALSGLTKRKHRQLRRFRDDVLRKHPIGKLGVDLLERHFPTISEAIFQDEDTFELAVRTLEPWLKRSTNGEILRSEIDAATVENFSRLAGRVMKRDPALTKQINLLKVAVRSAQGKRCSDLLRSSLSSSRGKSRRPQR